jgi:hypothetical protein
MTTVMRDVGWTRAISGLCSVGTLRGIRWPGRRSDAAEPDNPTVRFGAYDVTGRPRVLYLMIWGLPRLDD